MPERGTCLNRQVSEDVLLYKKGPYPQAMARGDEGAPRWMHRGVAGGTSVFSGHHGVPGDPPGVSSLGQVRRLCLAQPPFRPHSWKHYGSFTKKTKNEVGG
ncbi:hypothetical protein WH47_04247 [Habropoda laboriosa]|uniref:Uncharacterized protein n=1 Tax=Habropoda laboriosa TaxID=597456 RepID=A0A0L7QVN6_9HYME|nr:hypothetical protein WH47_04247 [Habropoda laboriosa]